MKRKRCSVNAKLSSSLLPFPVSEEFEFESILRLTLSLHFTHSAGDNTELISKQYSLKNCKNKRYF